MLRSNWVCSPEEVGTTKPVDCTWGVLPKFGESPVHLTHPLYFLFYTNLLFIFSAQVLPRLTADQLGRIERVTSFLTAKHN